MNEPTLAEVEAEIRETNEQIFNQQNLEYVDEAYGEDIVIHLVPLDEDLEGLEAVKDWVRDLHAAFPDFETEIVDVIATEDAFVTRYEMTGTHEGKLPDLDIEPTMKQVTVPGVSIHEMDGDKATEAWWYYDQLSMLRQLGVVPETPTP